jgi:hypothetical protein
VRVKKKSERGEIEKGRNGKGILVVWADSNGKKSLPFRLAQSAKKANSLGKNDINLG